MINLKKILIVIGLLTSLFFSFLIIFIVVSLVYTLTPKIELNSIYKVFPTDLADKITGEVFLMRGSEGEASGFRPQHTNLFITNYHVVSSLCEDLICEKVELKFNDNKNFYSFPLQVQYCSNWLDICILTPKGDHPYIEDSLNHNTIKGEQVFIIDRDNYDDVRVLNPNIRTGSVIGSSNSFLSLDLTTEHGYSGSPIYNTRGDFIGLISKLDNENTKLPLLSLVGCAIKVGLFGKCSSQFTKAVKLNTTYLKEIIMTEKSIQIELGLLLEELKQTINTDDCSFSVSDFFKTHYFEDAFDELCFKNPNLTLWQRKLGTICRSANHYNLKVKNVDLSDNEDLIQFKKLYFKFKSGEVFSKSICKMMKGL